MQSTLARGQTAKFFELRAALDPRAPLARPGQDAASPRTARSGLRVVYRGVQTRDLKEAKALLDELGPIER